MLISIHALRKESDPAALKALGAHVLFQSTLSVRRATGQANTNAMTNLFQSTLSVRRATIIPVIAFSLPYISIHALRKESDHRKRGPVVHHHISIHALRKESDL